MNIHTAGPRGPALLQDIWLIEKLAHFDREVIPERRMHARDIVGNNTPVFYFRDSLGFSDLNHAVKRDPWTGMRSAYNQWDFFTLLPESLHQVTIDMSDRGIPRMLASHARFRQPRLQFHQRPRVGS